MILHRKIKLAFQILLCFRCLFYKPLNSPKTPLRLLAIMGLDLGARLSGFKPSGLAIRQAALACDLIAEVNRFYDEKKFSILRYRQLRSGLSSKTAGGSHLITYRKFLKKYKLAQKSHKESPSTYLRQSQIANREAEMWQIILVLSSYFQDAVGSCSEQLIKFESYKASLNFVGLLFQLTDDLLDFKQDRIAELPSFVQAYHNQRHIKLALRARLNRYLRGVCQDQSEAWDVLVVVGYILNFVCGCLIYYRTVELKTILISSKI